ncbi:MAG: hypothetical protein R3E68_22470 [Burkholderiaceae bacterium]
MPLAITDLDRSEVSSRIVAALRDDAALTLRETDEATAVAAVNAGDVRPR